MQIELALDWVVAVLLCATRLGMVLLLTPLLDGFGLPARVKMALILALAACMAADALPVRPPQPAPFAMQPLVLAMVAEVLNGAVLAAGVHCAFGAVALAAKLIDVQLGFGLGSVFDPLTARPAALTGTLLGLLATVLFFVGDLHHVLLRGLAVTLQQLPLGALLHDVSARAVVRQFGTVFTVGLAIGAPLVICMVVLDIGLGVIARNQPQLNVFVLSAPVKLAVGLGMLGLLAPQFHASLGRTFAAIFSFWEAVLP